jgi:Domain of Unknown Function (DUF1080)
MTSRRNFIHQAGAGVALAPLASIASAIEHSNLIASIEKVTLRRGRDGSGPTWFHPRACIVPSATGSMVFMTLQTITGSDYFGPVQWMSSLDSGQTWTEPQPVLALGRRPHPDGGEEGVCDVVPEWHAPTKTVLALGHNVFYNGPKFSTDQPPRWPIYAVWRDGQWGERRKLEWDDPRGAYIYSNNCGQRVVLDDGDILLAFTHGAVKNQPRSVSSVICSFDGNMLAVKRVGQEIPHDQGRGLLEPSLTKYRERFFLTLRAEDNYGYVCASDDGLNWSAKQPWRWDDGEALAMSTTQQHWLAHSEALWLVYTRKDASNTNVLRWRSPLWMAQVDTRSLRLLRHTERVVLPLVGDGVNDPDRVAIMGNFHPLNVSSDESWVTVGEWQPRNGIKGDLLLARIRWSLPNALVEVDHRSSPDFVSLFNSRDLENWTTMQPGNRSWSVVDGVIDCNPQGDERGDQNLWSKKEYRDFEFWIDWRIKESPYVNRNARIILPDGTYKKDDAGNVIGIVAPNTDSGIFLRGKHKSQINIWCWPIGSGEVWGYRTDPAFSDEVRAGVTPKINADRPIGQWNTFRIVMQGDQLSVWLNGKQVIDKAQLPGVPREGPIALQHHAERKDGEWGASLMQFRNVYIKELRH